MSRWITATDLPESALLWRYHASHKPGSYSDCFAVDVEQEVSLGAFIEAFYTTWVFKLERWILAKGFNKPSTDEGARDLATGGCDGFAAWRVEDRRENQILMCDFQDRTRSWLMVAPATGANGTTLHFGSAVVSSAADGDRIPTAYRMLLVFHRGYSRVLLDAARRRLRNVH